MPRSQLEPPSELVEMVFPFMASAEVSLLPSQGTAKHFIHSLRHLATVLLQDTASLLLDGKKHIVFNEPVFKSPEFILFKDMMETHLSSSVNPLDRSLSSVVPGNFI